MGKRKQIPALQSDSSFGSNARINPWTRSDESHSNRLNLGRVEPPAAAIPSTDQPATSITGSLLCIVTDLVSEMPLRSIGTLDRDRAASKCTARSPCLST